VTEIIAVVLFLLAWPLVLIARASSWLATGRED